MLQLNKIYCGDCIELMKQLEYDSVDMILCDLPYGTTACKWDIIIPFNKLWNQYKRILKDSGFIVLTASQPFTTQLINSNLEWFKYELIWNKVKPSGHLNAKIMPLKVHENILIFTKNRLKYNPIMQEQKPRISKNYLKRKSELYGNEKQVSKIRNKKYPSSIITFSNANQSNKIHPTQKPVALFRYLIKTYSNEGDLVLDNCIGSGTTAVACKQTNRNFIGIEKEQKYIDIANKRLSQNTLLEVSANSSHR